MKRRMENDNDIEHVMKSAFIERFVEITAKLRFLIPVELWYMVFT